MGKKRSKMGPVASTISQRKITRKISRLEKTLPSAISGPSYCVELDAVASSLQKKQSKDIDFYSKMYPRVENLQKCAKHTLMGNKYTPDQLMSQQSSNDQASVYSTKANQNIETVIFIEGEKPVSTKGRRTPVPEIHQPNRVNSTYSTTRSSSSRQDVNASGRPKSKQGKNVGQKQESERLSTTFVKKSSDGRTFGPTYQVQRSEFRRPASDMEPKSHPEMHNHIETNKWMETDVVAGDTDYQRFGNQNIQASSSSCTTKCANSMSPEQVMQNSSKEKFPETRGTWQNDQTSSLSTDSDYRRSKTDNSVGYTRPASDGRGRRQGTGFRQQTSVGYSTVTSTGAALIETQQNYSLESDGTFLDSQASSCFAPETETNIANSMLPEQSLQEWIKKTYPNQLERTETRGPWQNDQTSSLSTTDSAFGRSKTNNFVGDTRPASDGRGRRQGTGFRQQTSVGYSTVASTGAALIETQQNYSLESDGTFLDSQASSCFAPETETNIANSMLPEQRLQEWIKKTYPNQLERTETRGPWQNDQTSSLSTTDSAFGRSKTNNFVGDTRPASDERGRRQGTGFRQQTSVGYSTVASTGAALIETQQNYSLESDGTFLDSQASSCFAPETETNIANSMLPEQRLQEWIKKTYPNQLERTETRGPWQNDQTSSLSTTDSAFGRSKTNNFVGDTRPASDGRGRRQGTGFRQQTSVGYSTVASTGAVLIETQQNYSLASTEYANDSGTKPRDTSGHQSSAPSVDNRNQQNGTSYTNREMSQDFITPYEHGTEIEAERADAATEEQTQDNYVNNRHAQETSVSTSRTGRKKQDGRVEEKKDEALEIVDVHQYFRNDFNLKELDQLDDLTKIGKVLDQAMNFENPVREFHETNYSIEYFVLDEKLMRLIEYLDKIRCQDDEVIQKKVAAIEYIRGLHAILDERASDD